MKYLTLINGIIYIYFILWLLHAHITYSFFSLNLIDDLSRDYYREFTEEMKVGFDKDHLKLIDTLNVQQRAAFDEILDHVLNKRSCVFFVDGPGGTGKTSL